MKEIHDARCVEIEPEASNSKEEKKQATSNTRRNRLLQLLRTTPKKN